MKTLILLAALQGIALPSFASDVEISCDSNSRAVELRLRGDSAILSTPGERMVKVDGLYFPQKLVTEKNSVTNELQLKLLHQNGQIFSFVKVSSPVDAIRVWDSVNPKASRSSRSLVNAKVIANEYTKAIPDGASNGVLKLLYDVDGKAPAYAGFCQLNVKR